MGKAGKYVRKRKGLALPGLLCSAILLCGTLTACRMLMVLPSAASGETEAAAPPPALTASPVPTPPPDRVAPVISGQTDRIIYQDDDISLMEGVTAVDDRDPAPVLELLDDGLDLGEPGVYTVWYVASDSAGNESTASATVTVLEKREGYAPMEEIASLADTLLKGIITPEMDTEGQIQAIYTWARGHIAYLGHSDKSDRFQAAWLGMTQRGGDCFTFFSVCKLFFDRLEIPNLDVVKVPLRPTDASHYWSMVSADGGETWYHFDATPRVGAGDDFCMVTDQFLDAYSEKHNGSHNRDTTLYPATPEE